MNTQSNNTKVLPRISVDKTGSTLFNSTVLYRFPTDLKSVAKIRRDIENLLNLDYILNQFSINDEKDLTIIFNKRNPLDNKHMTLMYIVKSTDDSGQPINTANIMRSIARLCDCFKSLNELIDILNKYNDSDVIVNIYVQPLTDAVSQITLYVNGGAQLSRPLFLLTKKDIDELLPRVKVLNETHFKNIYANFIKCLKEVACVKQINGDKLDICVAGDNTPIYKIKFKNIENISTKSVEKFLSEITIDNFQAIDRTLALHENPGYTIFEIERLCKLCPHLIHLSRRKQPDDTISGSLTELKKSAVNLKSVIINKLNYVKSKLLT